MRRVRLSTPPRLSLIQLDGLYFLLRLLIHYRTSLPSITVRVPLFTGRRTPRYRGHHDLVLGARQAHFHSCKAGIGILTQLADSPSQEVSWQSAFWSLLPLALSCMTQPSGQVLQYPHQLRTYLRSSPIICAFDALAQLIRFSVYLLSGYYTSPLDAATRAMRVRTRPLRDSGPQEGFQTLETLTSVRWLIFVIGTLTQAVKLMATSGLHWTKAWGGLFLASFGVMECFIVAASFRQPPTSGSYTLLAEEDETNHALRPRWMRDARYTLERNLDLFELFWGYLALALHCLFLGWASYVLLHPFINFTGLLKDETDNSLYSVTLVVWIPVIYLATLAYMCGAWIWLALWGSGDPLAKIIGTIIGLLLLTAFPVGLVTLFTLVEKEQVLELLTGWAITILACIGAMGISWVLGEVLALDDFIRYKVLLVDREEEKGMEKTRWSIAAWSILGGTFSLAICYYAFRYDPKGTHKPEWTNFFG